MSRAKPQNIDFLASVIEQFAASVGNSPKDTEIVLLRALVEVLPWNSVVGLSLRSLLSPEGDLSPVATFLALAGDRSQFEKPGRAMWKDRRSFPELAGLTPPAFIVAIYGDRFHEDYGMRFSELKTADVGCYRALENWLSWVPANGIRNQLPEGFGLVSTAHVSQLKAKAIRESLVLRRVHGALTANYR
jgi:hypothetical protein